MNFNNFKLEFVAPLQWDIWACIS